MDNNNQTILFVWLKNFVISYNDIMISLSVCLIVKNEENNLANCLDCVKQFADEIVVVDTGSTDKTIDIAKKYTEKVYSFKWQDDFSLARNFSFSKATSDYIMWLDADDIILQEEITKINNLKKELNPAYDMVVMKYVNACDESGKEISFFFRERIIKNNKNFKWEGFVHEVIPIQGNVLHSNICIHHNKKETIYTKRNLILYQKALKRNVVFTNRDNYYYARELYYHKQYKKAIKFLKLFLKLEKNNFNDIFEANLILSDCYALQNNFEKALQTLIDCFKTFIPNSKLLCKIGDIFLVKKDFWKAIYWYELALQNYGKNEFVFIEKSFENIYPYLQLCVCYYNLKDLNKAKYYNQKAEEINSEHQSVKLNNEFFKKVMK